jgi:hypothetical protein
MQMTLLAYGLAISLAGTVVLRMGGQYLLRPDSVPAILGLLAISVPAMAWLARTLCRLVVPRPADWPAGAIALVLPTLALDPFSSAFFAEIFPNIRADAAGLFGGWMLCCCAGALLGVTLRRPATP